jgi:hypothetical protein
MGRRAVTKPLMEQPAFAVALPLTSAERRDLLVIIRQREKVAMADAAEYKAVLIANFERKLATIYKPDDHPVWAQVHAMAKKTESEARAAMARTFRELGIPEAWAPSISLHWYGRGENAARERRVELRRVAASEAERRQKMAQAAIKRRSVEAQERVMATGLSSEAAKALLGSLPSAKELMPELELEAIEKIAAPDDEDRHYGLLDDETNDEE